MTLCPIAIVIGCKKCPIFKVCPAKGIIGDYKQPLEAPANLRARKPKTGTKRPK